MTASIGDRLLTSLRDFQGTTNWQVLVAEVDGIASRWQLSGSTWKATVVVDPRRWIGLEFEARDPITGRRVSYDIDTDLYDITADENLKFANEIERDIVEFLDNLRNGDLVRGYEGSKIVLTFPLNGSYVRVVKGRFATTAYRVEKIDTRGEGYVAVV